MLLYINCKACGEELVFMDTDPGSFESGSIDDNTMYCPRCGTENLVKTKHDFKVR